MTGDLHHLAAAYALDALDDAERAEFEAHYPTCEICRQEVDQFRETAGLLAEGSAATPPAGLERSVMDAIARTPQDRPDAAHGTPTPATVISLDERRRRFSVGAFVASAAAVAILVLGAVVIVGQRDGASVDDVLAAPDAVVTTLALTPDGEVGSFQVVWSPATDRVAVLADDLPDPGADRVYELWAIGGDTPVSAGLFEPEGGSVRDVVDVDDIDDIDAAAWGVTVEPAGGSDVPTTPILFFAEA